MSAVSPLVGQVEKSRYDTAGGRVRKTRCDKKHDIRIPVTEEEKWWIRTFAGENRMSMTKFSTLLVEKGLMRSYEYSEANYSDSENVVHAKVSQDVYKELISLSAGWDCSVRQATYRVFKHMLILEINEG